jgi:hypothetical protein
LNFLDNEIIKLVKSLQLPENKLSIGGDPNVQKSLDAMKDMVDEEGIC